MDPAARTGLVDADTPTDDPALLDDDARAQRANARRIVERARRRDAARQSRVSAWLAVLAVLSGFLIAFTADEATFAPDTFGRLVSGDLEVLEEARWRTVDPGQDVPFQAVLRVGPLQEAALEVRDGSIHLAPGTRATTNPGTVQLELGAALFEVETFWLGTSPALVARGDGAWRLDADVNPRVASYRGSVSATNAATVGQRPEAVTLTRYQEVRTAAGALADVGPLTYTTDDDWDVRLLPSLFAIDDAVANVGAGIERTYGTAPRGRGFYEAFTAVDDGIELALSRFDTLDEDGFGPPADVLVAVLVTRLIVEQSVVTFPVAVDEVDTARAAGATWGIVLARRDLRAADFIGALDLSLREIADLGDAAPPPAPASTPTPSPTSTPSPTPTPTPSPSPSPTPSPTPTPTDDPTPEPSPDPTEIPDECDGSAANAPSCVAEVVENLLDVVDDLIPPVPDALRSPARVLRDALALALRR